jgi:hypothetical protein
MGEARAGDGEAVSGVEGDPDQGIEGRRGGSWQRVAGRVHGRELAAGRDRRNIAAWLCSAWWTRRTGNQHKCAELPAGWAAWLVLQLNRKPAHASVIRT